MYLATKLQQSREHNDYYSPGDRREGPEYVTVEKTVYDFLKSDDELIRYMTLNMGKKTQYYKIEEFFPTLNVITTLKK